MLRLLRGRWCRSRAIEVPSEIGQLGLRAHRNRVRWARRWCRLRRLGSQPLLPLFLLLILGGRELQEWFGRALEWSARALLHDKLTATNIGRH